MQTGGVITNDDQEREICVLQRDNSKHALRRFGFRLKAKKMAFFQSSCKNK